MNLAKIWKQASTALSKFAEETKATYWVSRLLTMEGPIDSTTWNGPRGEELLGYIEYLLSKGGDSRQLGLRVLEKKEAVCFISSTLPPRSTRFIDFENHENRAVLNLIASLEPEEQTRILSAPGNLRRLMMTQNVMPLIEKLSPDQQTRILSGPKELDFLERKKFALPVMNILEKLSDDQKMTILTADRFMIHNMAPLSDNETRQRMFDLIDKLATEQKLEVLETTDAIYDLSKSDASDEFYTKIKQFLNVSEPPAKSYAPELLDFIKSRSQDEKARLLSARYAVEGLVDAGYANDVFAMIASFESYQQGQVLSRRGSVESFVNAGFENELMERMPTFPSECIKDILIQEEAVCALVKKGYGLKILELTERLDHAQQVEALKTGWYFNYDSQGRRLAFDAGYTYERKVLPGLKNMDDLEQQLNSLSNPASYLKEKIFFPASIVKKSSAPSP